MNHGKICISVCAETADELIKQIKRAEDLADVIEIRFDCLQEDEFAITLKKFPQLNNSKPLLATFRPKDKNAEIIIGFTRFSSGEQKRKVTESHNHRRSGWNKIISNENIDYLDFETDVFLDLFIKASFGAFEESSNEFSTETYDNIKKKTVIASEHFFESVPADLDEIYHGIKGEKSDLLKGEIIKIAAQADDITETIAVWKLLELAKSENKQIIPIAMGESGKWTRILGLAHGAFMTYASLEAGGETAPGQVSARDLIEVYRVRELDEKTEVYGIVAGNTSYSMSPLMHNAAFVFHRLNAVFVPLQVQNLDEFMRRMVKLETREIKLNFKGFSVTNPHKRNIIKHLDYIDETAQKIGAVNTVKIADGKLYGYNTDAQGFIEPLLNSYGDLNGAKVAILGAGGAARACVYALRQEGANVMIFARNSAKAESLADDFQVESKELPISKTQNLNPNFNDYDILVNCTPLGTKGELELETPAIAEQFNDIKLAYDLVYNPFQTKFMQEAAKVHVPVIGGMAMLAAQAAAQQKIWTNLDAPIREMSAAVLQRLK